MAWLNQTSNPSAPDISESSFIPSDIKTVQVTSPSDQSSWSSSSFFGFPTSTVGIFLAASTGLTLVGATSYYIVTRYWRKKGHGSKDADSDDISDDDEYIYKNYDKRKQRIYLNNIPQPLMTFDELHERAYLL